MNDIGAARKARVKDPIQRFWSYVPRRDGDSCWLWAGAKATAGYGRIYWGGRVLQAHRVAYQLEVGPIPDGLEIDHLCRTPGCVNPKHLEPVTPRINKLRGTSPPAGNAIVTSCSEGHPFDEANTYIWHGGRFCRACRARREARRKARIVRPVLTGSCVMCGTAFEFVRHLGGRAPNTCSESCTAARKRKAARDSARRRRARLPI